MSLANYDEWLRLSEVDESDVLSEVLGGLLSSEDLKWGDLEFLDLASGPQITSEIKNRNKNPTLGYPYADHFLEKYPAPSSVASEAPFRVTEPPSLDLEKTILADLFSSSDTIEPQKNDEEKNDKSDESNKQCETQLLESFDDNAKVSEDHLPGQSEDFGLESGTEIIVAAASSLNDKNEVITHTLEGLEEPVQQPSKLLATVSLKTSDASETSIQVEDYPYCHKLQLNLTDAKGLVRHLRPLTATEPFRVVKSVVGLREEEARRRRFGRMKAEPSKVSSKEDLDWLQSVINKVEVVVEDGKRTFSCLLCGTAKVSFNRLSKLRLHLMTHRQIRPYKCSSCHRGFFSNYNLKRHQLSHTSKPAVKNYRCKSCNSNFSNVHNLANHIRLKHQHQGTKRDSNNNEKGKHDKSCLICPLQGCGRGFTTRGHLQTHLKFAHSPNANSSKSFTCSVCQSTFKSASKLRRHERTHDKNKARQSFKCDECGSGFVRKEHLTKHKVNVHKSIQFRCPVLSCDYKYPSLNHICKHFKENHKREDSKMQCVLMQCLENQPNLTALRQHLEECHHDLFRNGEEGISSSKNPLNLLNFLMKIERTNVVMNRDKQLPKPLVLYEETVISNEKYSRN